MDTLDYDYTLHQDRFRADANLWVRFTEDLMEDEQKTKLAGKPIFRDVTLIHIMVPGDKRNIICREISENDKLRFAKQWSTWQKTKSEIPEGIPLSQWAGVTRALAANLQYFGFQTVEQLANASEAACANHTGLRELKRRATLYLQQMQDLQPLNQMQSELDDRDSQIAILREQVQAMQAMLQQVQSRMGTGSPVQVNMPAAPVPGSVAAKELIDLGA